MYSFLEILCIVYRCDFVGLTLLSTYADCEKSLAYFLHTTTNLCNSVIENSLPVFEYCVAAKKSREKDDDRNNKV